VLAEAARLPLRRRIALAASNCVLVIVGDGISVITIRPLEKAKRAQQQRHGDSAMADVLRLACCGDLSSSRRLQVMMPGDQVVARRHFAFRTKSKFMSPLSVVSRPVPVLDFC
jgi:hypothetical protein